LNRKAPLWLAILITVGVAGCDDGHLVDYPKSAVPPEEACLPGEILIGALPHFTCINREDYHRVFGGRPLIDTGDQPPV
jgi:hypothetical protein